MPFELLCVRFDDLRGRAPTLLRRLAGRRHGTFIPGHFPTTAGSPSSMCEPPEFSFTSAKYILPCNPETVPRSTLPFRAIVSGGKSHNRSRRRLRLEIQDSSSHAMHVVVCRDRRSAMGRQTPFEGGFMAGHQWQEALASIGATWLESDVIALPQRAGWRYHPIRYRIMQPNRNSRSP